MAVVFTLGGRMFVAGGKGSSEDSLSLKLFDSVMNSWSWVASMLTPRCNFAGCIVVEPPFVQELAAREKIIIINYYYYYYWLS